MRKSADRLLAMAALAMGFGFGAPAHAEDWKIVGQFGGLSVAKAHEIDKMAVSFSLEYEFRLCRGDFPAFFQEVERVIADPTKTKFNRKGLSA
jgi:hypothetical protein